MRPATSVILQDQVTGKTGVISRARARSGSSGNIESLTETQIEHDGKRFVVRSAPRPAASLAIRAAGVALPPTVRQVAD
jgi:hypothetical protein